MEFNSYKEYEEYHNKMDEFKRRREEREDAMPFLEFLKTKLSEVERLTHRDKTDHAYHEAHYIMQRITSRLQKEGDTRKMIFTALPESQHLKLTEQVLDKYKFNASDKRKREVINEFRKDLMDDLDYMIKDREPTPDSSIRNDEV